VLGTKRARCARAGRRDSRLRRRRSIRHRRASALINHCVPCVVFFLRAAYYITEMFVVFSSLKAEGGRGLAQSAERGGRRGWPGGGGSHIRYPPSRTGKLHRSPPSHLRPFPAPLRPGPEPAALLPRRTRALSPTVL